MAEFGLSRSRYEEHVEAMIPTLGTKLLIKKNVLLRGGEPTLSLEDALRMRDALRAEHLADKNLVQLESALSSVEAVHMLYGESGLFRLFFFASANRNDDFDHFYEVIAWIMALAQMSRPDQEYALQCDNQRLPEGVDLLRFNSHVMIPSLSRKLYNPGRHFGYLVYGIGGPRILVSLPFKGATSSMYDVYTHSVDVATSLITRGYHGSFLFLDNLPGLNREIEGVPSWLLWFSLIAAHSDLVIYISIDNKLTSAQMQEAAYTPDRVQKKIVDMPGRELRWAEQSKELDPSRTIWIVEGKTVTWDEYLEYEASHAKPLLEGYSQPIGRRDGLIRFDAESGETKLYPWDYPLYR